MSRHFRKDRAIATATRVAGAIYDERTKITTPLPSPSLAVLDASQDEVPIQDLDSFCVTPDLRKPSHGNILYLAYGSNLSAEKFRGSRGIRPLSQVNVQVPALRLTFDLPGIPYTEPCFANSGLRDPQRDLPPPILSKERADSAQAVPLSTPDYHKDRWHKGLIGIVYEVTPEDYAHIIATEGGGSSYQDIVVDCFPFATDDLTVPVPWVPRTTPLKAHTLFAPGVPAHSSPEQLNARFQRPDPSYAQPSTRYLKLITDGAAEARLPLEYQEYLQDIRPYRITTYRQRIGQAIFLAFWGPIVLLVLGLSKIFAGPDGKLPSWMQAAVASVFKYVWVSYDNGFRRAFGDGERTIGDSSAQCLSEKGQLSPQSSLDVFIKRDK